MQILVTEIGYFNAFFQRNTVITDSLLIKIFTFAIQIWDMPMKYQEEEIVRYLRAENVICVKMVFDNYYRILCIFALRFLSSFEDAEDVVQDVFLSFWEKKKGTSFEGTLKSYFFGAVQRAALNRIRNSKRLVFEEIESHVNRLSDDSMENDEDMTIRREKLYEEIERLPEKCREVFVAIALNNLSYKDVAERLGVSVNTVKTHYVRALKQLRSNLDTIILVILFWQGRDPGISKGSIRKVLF